MPARPLRLVLCLTPAQPEIPLPELAAKRLGKIALRAGLADLDIEDAALLKEFQPIAARFRGGAKVKAGEAAPAHSTNGTGEEAHHHG
jgi:hypothetical protein